AGSLTLNGVAVAATDVVAATDIGLLVFTPGADDNGSGYASFTFSVKDSAGTFDTTPRTITLDVTPVDDPPTGADKTITTDEDTAHTFAASDFGFADVDGDTLAAVRIDTVPGAGSLTLNGVAVAATDVVAATDIGLLVFTPGADDNGSGYASFTFSVKDSAGTFDTTPRTITFDVTPVNDAPVISSNGGAETAAVTIAENTTAVTQVVAADPDSVPAFAITGGADAALFTIDPVNGSLAFLSAPDFEEPADADGNNTYEVIVQASDGQEADSQTITVMVSNVGGVTIRGTNGANKVDAATTVPGQPLPTGEEDRLWGGRGNDKLSALGGDDQIHGGGGDDDLFGDTGNDLLVGNADDDHLFGGDGNDILFGGRGHDRLHGGNGADLFGFGAALRAANVDRIGDFKAGEDLIGLDHHRFGAIGATLDAAEFRVGGKAKDGNDHILFKKSSGGIYYDPDGKGGAHEALFAKIDPGTQLHFDDFVIV
ncbi:MAG: cadherin domain-containing protein, partial [Bauldia sp.]|nr:cadherin domain-containing protein [Bauldia sp.]